MSIPKPSALVVTTNGSSVDCNITFQLTCRIAERKTRTIAREIIFYIFAGALMPRRCRPVFITKVKAKVRATL